MNLYGYIRNNPINGFDIFGLDPNYGDKQLVQASAGYQSILLGAPGQAAADQAALHGFVSAIDSPLSPFNFIDGIPNPASESLEESISAFQKGVAANPAVGASCPSMTDLADNVFSKGLQVLNLNPPYEGVTNIQTATYTQSTFLFGLINLPWGSWVNDAPINTAVLGGPAGGYYLSPGAASAAAAASLTQQLTGMGYIVPAK